MSIWMVARRSPFAVCIVFIINKLFNILVRMKGLEPILLTEPDPKSGAATNYATSADFFEGAKLQKILIPCINNKKYIIS